MTAAKTVKNSLKTAPKKPRAFRNFASALVSWQRQHGRKDLPWQVKKSPYHTWLSEIMLQQTQVKTVIPYYQRFIASYSDVGTLANASIDDVLHLWTGLGYYSRARNLHQCAQIVSKHYQGKFPQQLSELEALPGIGRSTAGAILSLSMGIAAPILDGNVKRVLCRFHSIEGWSGENETQKRLWQITQHCIDALPPEQAGTFNQALMDLGSGICKRGKPLCELCPLAPACSAYQDKTQHLYPTSKPKKALPEKSVYMLLLQNNDGRILLEQRPPQGIWGGLWSLPEFSTQEALALFCSKLKSTHSTKTLDTVQHTFSHFRLLIHPLHCHIRREPANISEKQQLWYSLTDNNQRLGLASPIKKLIEQVSNA